MIYEFVVSLSRVGDYYGPFRDYNDARDFLKKKGLEKKKCRLRSPDEFTAVVDGQVLTARISTRPRLRDVSEFPSKISK